jgi:hypothetical protein
VFPGKRRQFRKPVCDSRAGSHNVLVIAVAPTAEHVRGGGQTTDHHDQLPRTQGRCFDNGCAVVFQRGFLSRLVPGC